MQPAAPQPQRSDERKQQKRTASAISAAACVHGAIYTSEDNGAKNSIATKSTDKDEHRVEHCEDRMHTESLCTLTKNSVARFSSQRAESS